jgi:hypothetical protein
MQIQFSLSGSGPAFDLRKLEKLSKEKYRNSRKMI